MCGYNERARNIRVFSNAVCGSELIDGGAVFFRDAPEIVCAGGEAEDYVGRSVFRGAICENGA